jgi:hypothetical protein
MKKKVILLIVGLIVVSGLAFFSWKVVKGSGSSVESELIEFAIPEVEKIDRIVITDNFGRVADLRLPKGSKEWTDKDGNCIAQTGVDYILDACKKIEFKGYVNDNAVETNKKLMMSQHIKVEYYLEGKWHKTWYVGPPAKDHLGQVMLLESRELGRSDKPVIMTIKGMYGIIEPRFYADPLKWKCTQIFQLDPDEIKKVEVTYPLEPARSFSVERLGLNHRYSVKQQNIPLPAIDTQFVMSYLNKFKKIHYEIPNYTLNPAQVDSLKKTSPFCILTVDTRDGKSQRIRMFRIPSAEGDQLNEFGQPVNYEVDRFWAELPGGEMVKCQYFVFDPITLGHIYFPLDLSSLDLNNYEVKSPDQYRK